MPRRVPKWTVDEPFIRSLYYQFREWKTRSLTSNNWKNGLEILSMFERKLHKTKETKDFTSDIKNKGPSVV